MITSFPALETTPHLDDLLIKNVPVAAGVSGGGDSDVNAFEIMRHLDSIGHTGPRILIHSDLGRVEWRSSLPQCERLAQRLSVELVVVRRGAGDLMDRWLQQQGQSEWIAELEKRRKGSDKSGNAVCEHDQIRVAEKGKGA